MGRDTLILAGPDVRHEGAIPASGNIAPDLCVGIYESFEKGDIEAAKGYQSRLTRSASRSPSAPATEW